LPSKVNSARIILKVVGWINIAFAGTFLCIFLMGAVIIGSSKEEYALPGSFLLGGLGLALCFFFAACGAVQIFTAGGIATRKPWARILGIALGFIQLMAIPIGTALGVFILMGLLGDEAGAWFAGTGAVLPGGQISR
jgi:hypothetical protein